VRLVSSSRRIQDDVAPAAALPVPAAAPRAPATTRKHASKGKKAAAAPEADGISGLFGLGPEVGADGLQNLYMSVDSFFVDAPDGLVDEVMLHAHDEGNMMHIG
jgi:hypothetical protein